MVLAIKINIVLEIDINGSSSAGTSRDLEGRPKSLANAWQKRRHRQPQNSFRIIPLKVTFHFKISRLATLQFIEDLKENKDRKHLRGSRKIAKKTKKKKLRANEETGGPYSRTLNWETTY